MRNRLLLAGLALSVALPAAYALDVVPVWEHTLLDGGAVLPTLVISEPDPRWDGDPEDGPWYGVNLHDQYDGFVRYDANRLLLGIRDNGIDETDPNHNAALAAQYPDRSIIWINPEDGSPMGVAIHVGFKPVELSAEYESMIDGGSGNPPIEGYEDPKNRRFVSGAQSAPEYMNFDVSDDGVVYLGYWYMILRYDPDGNGGFTGPTVVYEQDYRNHGGTQRLSQWRFGDIEVMGSGATTRVILSGKTWRNGMRVRVFDVDATTNTWTLRGAYGEEKNGCFGEPGGYSETVINADNEEVLYGAGNITGNNVWRYFWNGVTYEQDSPDLFVLYPPEDADGWNHALPTRWAGDVAAHQDLDYIVVATTPSWGSQGNSNEIDKPGFVSVYSVANETFGDFLGDAVFGGTKERPPVESDEPSLAPSGAAVWNGIMCQVEVNRLPGYGAGACEILYLSQVYGYGRYVIGATNVDQWSLF
ncbi:MAG TPA: hypothetical protein PK878_13990 [bacterium]|nr:hypothetical protein [Candidatus Omnitrophota bacterium]HOJ61391.1 hypothetical protein [bacterium]HOL95910.1 hypothetical protein [bacterium]HPP02717.1 hypothetical protein [bacterium]HXK92198.1 hypothetical protein [bacterium]